MFGNKSVIVAGLVEIAALLQMSTNTTSAPSEITETQACLLSILITIIWLVIWAIIGLWVYKDAEKRGMNGALWLLIVLVAAIIGLIIYFIVRKKPEQPQMPAAPPPPPAYGAPPPPTYGVPPPPPAAPGMAPCPYCGTQNPTTATICQRCGAKLR